MSSVKDSALGEGKIYRQVVPCKAINIYLPVVLNTSFNKMQRNNLTSQALTQQTTISIAQNNFHIYIVYFKIKQAHQFYITMSNFVLLGIMSITLNKLQLKSVRLRKKQYSRQDVSLHNENSSFYKVIVTIILIIIFIQVIDCCC